MARRNAGQPLTACVNLLALEADAMAARSDYTDEP
jgi:hypothetical protein